MKVVRLSLFLFVLMALAAIQTAAQSTNIEFPTPITTDGITGKIKARDLGDPRTTTYYYVFEANQGDVILKIEARNLNGDMDIFYADGLRPVTKINFYADLSPILLAREIYFRKSEKLILKVEGRTPNDDPATFEVKFEGSFLAMTGVKKPEEPTAPEVKSVITDKPETKVNSVGTIVAVNPKPTPTPRPTIARNRRKPKTTTTSETVSTIKTPTKETKPNVESEPQTEKKAEEVVAETQPKPVENAEPTNESDKPKETEIPKETETPKTEPPVKEVEPVKEPDVAKEPEPIKIAKKKNPKKTPIAKKEPKPKKEVEVKKEEENSDETKSAETKTGEPDSVEPKKEVESAPKKLTRAEELAKAFENVRLVVEFKDGAKIERPMNDVFKFTVDRGTLIIVNKNGSVARYSMLQVAKISMQ